MAKWTIKKMLNLLDNTAKAKYTGSKKQLIKGNKKLELRRAKDVKNIEDMLENLLRAMNIRYVRKYKRMYKMLIK